MSARPPELDAAAWAMVQANADFVLIGGFAVIANRFVRATDAEHRAKARVSQLATSAGR